MNGVPWGEGLGDLRFVTLIMMKNMDVEMKLDASEMGAFALHLAEQEEVVTADKSVVEKMERRCQY